MKAKEADPRRASDFPMFLCRITRRATVRLYVLAMGLLLLRRSRARRSPGVQKLRYRRHKLRWRERLLQENAVGNALRCPFIAGRACHVHNRKFRFDFPDLSRDLPTVQRTF